MTRTDTERLEWLEKESTELTISMQQGGHNDGMIFIEARHSTHCGSDVRTAIDAAMNEEER